MTFTATQPAARRQPQEHLSHAAAAQPSEQPVRPDHLKIRRLAAPAYANPTPTSVTTPMALLDLDEHNGQQASCASGHGTYRRERLIAIGSQEMRDDHAVMTGETSAIAIKLSAPTAWRKDRVTSPVWKRLLAPHCG